MSEAQIEIKVGEIEFSGQGDQDWVAKQLDKILAKAEDLIKLVTPPPSQGGPEKPHTPASSNSDIASKTLPSFLSEKGATRIQVKKFLATAVWLHAKGKTRLTTSDVSKALKESNQRRIGNPSDCLNKNVGKGYCEKEGKEFFATDDGKRSL